jgi:hypothetical protein
LAGWVLLAGVVVLLQVHPNSAAAATCGAGTLDGSFASAAQEGSISSPGEADCYALPNLSAGDQVSIGFSTLGVVNSSPRWQIIDGNGNTVCGHFQSTTCVLSGAKGWSLEISDYFGQGTFSYTVVSRRLSNPQGCTALADPAAWSFADTRIDGAVDEPLGARCYTFSRAFGEADGSYWFRVVRSAGAWNPHWSVYGPSGSSECQGFSEGAENSCRLLGFGQYALVVSDYGGAQSGSFFATARRLTSPSGCASSPSIAFGVSPTTGSISGGGDTDCYALSGLATNDSVTVGLSANTGSAQSPRWTLIDGNGNYVCNSSVGVGGVCQLSGAAGWSLLVYDASGSGTFSYSLAIRRLTKPQGCASLGDPGVWSYASPRLNGSIVGELDTRCYTFSRDPNEEDGVYWFRTARSSGTLTPRWAVFGPSGSKECEGGENGLENRCRLLASGQYVFAVFDAGGEKSGSFYATSRRLTSPAGCAALPSLQFGDAPVSGDLSTGGSIDCYALPGAASGDSLKLGLVSSGGTNPSPHWTVVDANGNQTCDSSSYGYGGYCLLSGAAPWSLLVYDGGVGSFSYSLAARRLTNPQGCTPLGEPGAWSFTAARLNGSIGGTLDSRCYTFTRAASDPDGEYWFRTLRSSGTANPAWSVYGPTGLRECGGSTEGPENHCRLLASGQFTFIVGDSSDNGSGSFVATAKRLTQPSGCAPLSSIASGVPSTLGNLSAGSEIDCYLFPASSGDQFKFKLSGAADRYAVISPDGGSQCFYYYSQCQIAADGPDTLLVYAGGTGSGNYRLEAECENPPCGQTETSLVTTQPNRLGQSRFTTTLIRGHDLDLLDEVTLSKDGQQIQGEIQEPSKDARAVDVRFDLSAAAAGSWTLSGHFSDGSTRLLPGGIVVEATREGALSVEAVGRSAFRVGVPTPVSIVVHNSGNVDAAAVPVVLRGLPAGATLTPSFDSYAPTGSSGAVSMTKSPYDQASETLVENGEIFAPFLLSRLPAGRSTSMDFMVTVPTIASYKLRALVGSCLATKPAPQAAAAAVASAPRAVASAAGGDGATCAGEVAKTVAGAAFDVAKKLVPLSSCAAVATDLVIDGVVAAKGGEGFLSWNHFWSWAANGAWCLGEIIVPESTLIKAALKVGQNASLFVGAAGASADCLLFAIQAALDQQSVNSIDPNDIQGPAGVGPQHYIQANSPLTYKVLFENLPSAGAAAESIAIRDHLDNDVFDPGSVLFVGIRFGDVQYTLPYPSPTLDETFDLRPQTNVQVHVTGSVVGEELRADLVAVDPDTLETPEDPAIGVLSPNDDPPEGEGELLYTVAPQPLPSGATISNAASIKFDQNAPIITPTWSNVIDRQAPAPSIAATAAVGSLGASVSWSGSDDAAGISLWRLEVSKNGGPFQLWRTAAAPGAASFDAPEGGSYEFRGIAYDGAGNVGQSAIAGVVIGAGGNPPPETGPGTAPVAAPNPTPTVPTVSARSDDGCSASATAVFRKATKAAKRLHGPTRAKALKAARKKKKAQLARCPS